jgi:hypothetical protein
MGGSSQQPQQTSQTTHASSEPPAYIQPFLKEGVTDLSSIYRSTDAPDFYPNSTVAPFSPETQGALNWQTQRAMAGSPLTGAAQDQLTKTMQGDYLSPESNPYFSKAMEASFRPQTDQFMGKVIPGITSAFQGSNRMGSGLHQDTVLRATEDLSRAQSDSAAKAGADMYSMERQRQIDGMKFAPQLAMQDYFDINQLGVVGSTRDNQSQRTIDADIQRYNYGQNKDWNHINRYLASLNAGYPGGETNSQSYGVMPTQQRDPFGSIFGAGLGLAGLGIQAAPLFGFSDERLKENIVPVGETFGGDNLYLYNFKGDAAPQIGVLAQELEQKHPENVVEHPSGFKMVDYGAVAERGLF